MAITEFTSAADSLRPSETGVDATLLAARRSGTFLDQAATSVQRTGDEFARNVGTSIKDVGDSVVNYMTHQDVSQYNVASSALVANKTKQWNEALSGVKNPDWDGKDPNTQWLQKPLNPDDPSAVKNFMDGLNGDLDTLKNSMNTEAGQDHAESHNAALRAHFQASTAADISTAAATAARAKTVATVSNYSNAAVQDPAGVDNYAKLASNAIDNEFANHPGLKGAEGIKLAGEYKAQSLKQIYQSGAMSAIQKSSDPEATAADWSKRYPDYINGAEALTMAKAAKTQIKFNESLDRTARAQARQEQVDKASDFASGMVANLYQPGPPNPNTVKQLNAAAMPGPGHLPGLKPAEVLTLYKLNEEKVNGTGATIDDQPTITSLGAKLVGGSLTPLDTAQAVVDHKITFETAGKYNEMAKNMKEASVNGQLNTPGLKAVFEGAKAELVLPTYHSDFMQDFIPQYLKAVRDNTLKPGDLNFSDPNSMVSKAVADHQPTQAQKVQFKALQSYGMGLGDQKDQLKTINAVKVPDTMTKEELQAKYPGQRVIQGGRVKDVPELKK